MTRHIILWTLRPELVGEERLRVIDNIRTGLEGLKGQVPGLLDIHVYGGASALPSSNADVMLDSTLTDAEALKAYAVHPAHVYVADTFVRPFTAVRTCLDFDV
jgi:hypothetical protein